MLYRRGSAQGEWDPFIHQLGYLDIGVANGRPAVYIRGLSPPGVGFVVVEDSYGFGHIKQQPEPAAPAHAGQYLLGPEECRKQAERPYGDRRPRP